MQDGLFEKIVHEAEEAFFYLYYMIFDDLQSHIPPVIDPMPKQAGRIQYKKIKIAHANDSIALTNGRIHMECLYTACLYVLRGKPMNHPNAFHEIAASYIADHPFTGSYDLHIQALVYTMALNMRVTWKMMRAYITIAYTKLKRKDMLDNAEEVIMRQILDYIAGTSGYLIVNIYYRDEASGKRICHIIQEEGFEFDHI